MGSDEGIPSGNAGAGSGQSAADQPAIEVRAEDLERLGSVVGSGRPLLSVVVRQAAIRAGGNLDGAAVEMVVGYIQLLEHESSEHKTEMIALRTKAIGAHTKATSATRERTWQENFRKAIGTVIVTLGGSAFTYGLTLPTRAAVVVCLLGGAVLVAGLLLLSTNWLPPLVDRWLRKRRSAR